MARAQKAPKPPKAPRARKASKANHADADSTEPDDLVSGVEFDEDAAPRFVKKLTPEELTSIAVEGMELQGVLDALETEEGVLKEKAKLAAKQVKKRIKETRTKVSRLAKEYRDGVRELPAQAKLPGTEQARANLRVVSEAKEISTWATTPSPETPPPANDDAPPIISTPEAAEQLAADEAAALDAPEAAPVAADAADDGSVSDF